MDDNQLEVHAYYVNGPRDGTKDITTCNVMLPKYRNVEIDGVVYQYKLRWAHPNEDGTHRCMYFFEMILPPDPPAPPPA